GTCVTSVGPGGSPQSHSQVWALTDLLSTFTTTVPVPLTFPAPSMVPPPTPVKLNAATGDPGGGRVVLPPMFAIAPVRTGNSDLAVIGSGPPKNPLMIGVNNEKWHVIAE